MKTSKKSIAFKKILLNVGTTSTFDIPLCYSVNQYTKFDNSLNTIKFSCVETIIKYCVLIECGHAITGSACLY